MILMCELLNFLHGSFWYLLVNMMTKSVSALLVLSAWLSFFNTKKVIANTLVLVFSPKHVTSMCLLVFSWFQMLSKDMWFASELWIYSYAWLDQPYNMVNYLERRNIAFIDQVGDWKNLTHKVSLNFLAFLLMQEMICVIAEIASDRQLLAQKYNKKTKQTTLGIMQIEQETADWLVRFYIQQYFWSWGYIGI